MPFMSNANKKKRKGIPKSDLLKRNGIEGLAWISLFQFQYSRQYSVLFNWNDEQRGGDSSRKDVSPGMIDNMDYKSCVIRKTISPLK